MKHDTNIINRKTKFEYEFLDTYVAGIQLFGTEVKSIKNNKISLVDSYCLFIDDELFVKNLLIENLKNNSFPHIVNREKKLLLTKRELKRLKKDLTDGLTIVPYRVFVNEKNLIKIEIKLAKGKKIYDKRQTLKERDVEKNLRKKIY